MAEENTQAESNTLPCEIITPLRAVFKGEAVEVMAEGLGGTFEILPRHEPVMAPLTISIMQIKTPAEALLYAVHGGFLDMNGERVVIMADAAEPATEIDIERARAASARARERLDAVSGDADEIEIDEDRARLALLRANMRVHVVELNQQQN